MSDICRYCGQIGHWSPDCPEMDPKRMPEMVSELAALKAENERLGTQLARFSMCAGAADQYRAEARAARKALGFDPESHTVAPEDLTMAVDVLRASYQQMKAENERLLASIRKHRDQRGDDRCWMDDEELYRTLPEGFVPPVRDSSVELKNCERFIARRHNPATEYVSPEREIERLRTIIATADGKDAASFDWSVLAVIDKLETENERLNEALRTVFGLEPHENIVFAEHGSVLADGKGERISPTSDRKIALDAKITGMMVDLRLLRIGTTELLERCELSESRIAAALALADTVGWNSGEEAMRCIIKAMVEALKGE